MVPQLQLCAFGERTGHVHGGSPSAEARGHCTQGRHDFGRDAVAQHRALGEGVLPLGLLTVGGEERREAVERGDLGTRAPGQDRGQPEVVDVLMGDHEQLDVLDLVSAGAQGLLELVERLRRVRAGVDEGEGGVLDQVRVDPPDHERRGDGEPVDAGLGGPLELFLLGWLIPLGGLLTLGGSIWPGGCAGGRPVPMPAHERISVRTSSRRRSMSSWETSDSRHSRSRGSVLEGLTLKCQSS